VNVVERRGNDHTYSVQKLLKEESGNERNDGLCEQSGPDNSVQGSLERAVRGGGVVCGARGGLGGLIGSGV